MSNYQVFGHNVRLVKSGIYLSVSVDGTYVGCAYTLNAALALARRYIKNT